MFAFEEMGPSYFGTPVSNSIEKWFHVKAVLKYDCSEVRVKYL